jgi:Predicted transcriptional regulators
LNKLWKLCPFGERAEKIRKERGMPKTVLCRRLGISVTYYDFITHGERPGIRMQPKILKELGVNVKEAS